MKEIVQRAQLRKGEQVEALAADRKGRLHSRVAVADLEALFAGRAAEEWRELYREGFDWGEDIGRERLP